MDVNDPTKLKIKVVIDKDMRIRDIIDPSTGNSVAGVISADLSMGTDVASWERRLRLEIRDFELEIME
jgi:hypothetical protein